MGFWCLASLPFECVICGCGALVELDTGYVGSQASWEVQAKVSHCLCPAWGPPALSSKVICRWLPLVLDLVVPERGQAVNQIWLPQVASLRPLIK